MSYSRSMDGEKTHRSSSERPRNRSRSRSMDGEKTHRSSSERPRRSSQRKRWECETYRVTACFAVTGEIIGTWEVDDLFKVTKVRHLAASVLDVCIERVFVAYGKNAVKREEHMPLYKFVEFKRKAIFVMNLAAPKRCIYCRCISQLGYELRGRFELIDPERPARYDYRFNPNETDELEECEHLVGTYGERVKEILKTETNREIKELVRTLRTYCLCNLSAQELCEYGSYRALRFWKRIAEDRSLFCLRRRIRTTLRGSLKNVT